MALNVAIIGCGLIGRKRAGSLAGCRLAVCCDQDVTRARALAEAYPAPDPRSLLGPSTPLAPTRDGSSLSSSTGLLFWLEASVLGAISNELSRGHYQRVSTR